MTTSEQKQLKKLLQLVHQKRILKSLVRNERFLDEPRIYSYAGLISEKPDQEADPLVSAGTSFFSPETALLRCLGESIERYCWFHYKSPSEIMCSYSEIADRALNPTSISSEISDKNTLIWVKGFNLTRKRTVYIPRQLVYFNNNALPKEFPLSQPSISTGCAGGFDKTSTLLRGIYEVIERDSFMSFYLTKTKAPLIAIEDIEDPQVQYIRQQCKRFNLELYIFEVTTDLKIPAFLTILIDRTSVGPAISCGAKCSFDTKRAIYESMTEAFLTRTWIREVLSKNAYSPNSYKPKTITSVKERGLYWSHPSAITRIDYLIKQKKKKIAYTKRVLNNELQLKKVLAFLAMKGHEVFYVNLGERFLNQKYSVFKTIIPTLQPLYLAETEKISSLRKERLNEVSSFFGNNKYDINTVPHPFL